MSRLVIAEKPSAAQSIASVLGAANRKDGYLEGSGYLVSWCFGHLAELSDASAYNPDYAKWRYELSLIHILSPQNPSPSRPVREGQKGG